ncbi:MAG: O-antigen ligase family protein [Patescibacteria group bacterium]
MANKISRYFFIIFGFLLPWQTRLILFPEKPEYLGFGIYLSEIFLWLAILFWLPNLKKIKPPFIFLIFYFFGLLSLVWAPDKVAAFRVWLYLLEGGLVYFYLHSQKETRLIAAWAFLISLFAASIFGIWQFFNLGSPAFKWLGLAARGAWNLGDIVIEAGSGRWLRAYGPFPHPNIFGGYLAAAILSLFVILKPKEKFQRSLVAFRMTVIYVFGGVFLFALFLTFSRSAWLGFAIAAIYFIFKNFKKEKINFFVFLSVLFVALYFIFQPLVMTRVGLGGRLEQKSNTERVESWREGFASWRKDPFFGGGIGTMDYKLQVTNKMQEPPHNIFILVLTQLGAFGFFLYILFWRRLWKNKSLCSILILFLIIGVLDHYLWTLWSGQALFWATLGLSQAE